MKKKKKEETVEKRFPNARARAAADAAIEGLDAKLPMTVFLDTWIVKYAEVTGVDPMKLLR